METLSNLINLIQRRQNKENKERNLNETHSFSFTALPASEFFPTREFIHEIHREEDSRYQSSSDHQAYALCSACQVNSSTSAQPPGYLFFPHKDDQLSQVDPNQVP